MSTTNNNHVSEEFNNAIKMIGDSWTLCIVSNLANAPLRFCEIERAVAGINPTTLTDRLKKLEAEKMIERKEETVDKLSVVYSLTDKGQGILPILGQIQTFADKFLCEKH